jgi:membrane protease YdiL (CAAX protease family)
MMGRLLDRVLLDHWRAIEAERDTPSAGPRSAEYKAIVTVIVAGAVLTFMQYIVLRGYLQDAVSGQLPEVVGAFSPDLGLWLQKYRPLLRNISWSLGCAFCYLIVPGVVVKVLFRERLVDYGLSLRGYFGHLWIYALLFVPVGILVYIVSFQPAFQSSYPFYKVPYGWTDLLVWECFYALQFFALEFFFRGFMVRGLVQRFGTGAILFMVVPYCMIHFQKPFLETLGAIIAGLVLGILALRTRSIWGGATIHVAVAASMDVAALAQRGELPGG